MSEMLPPSALMRKPAWRTTINLSLPNKDAEDITRNDVIECATSVISALERAKSGLEKSYDNAKKLFPKYVVWSPEEEQEALEVSQREFRALVSMAEAVGSADEHDSLLIDVFSARLDALFDKADLYRFIVQAR